MRVVMLMWASIISSCAQAEINALTHAAYYQGALSDALVCYFKQVPTCITEPHLNENSNKKNTSISYFLPLTTLETSDIAKIMQSVNAHKHNYSISFKTVSQPVVGIKITIIYNPDVIEFSCDRKQIDPHSNTVAWRFIHRNTLKELNQHANTARWYALGKRQPRIVLDSIDQTQAGLSLMQALAHELKTHSNCEVIILPAVREKTAQVVHMHTNYINLVVQSDIALIFNRGEHTGLYALDKLSQETTAKQKYLLAELKQTLRNWLKTSCFAKNRKKQEHNALIREFLIGTEMPTISITYRAKTDISQFVKVLNKALKRYLRNMQKQVK